MHGGITHRPLYSGTLLCGVEKDDVIRAEDGSVMHRTGGHLNHVSWAQHDVLPVHGEHEQTRGNGVLFGVAVCVVGKHRARCEGVPHARVALRF